VIEQLTILLKTSAGETIMKTVFGEIDFAAVTRRKIAKGIDVPEHFAYFYGKSNEPWDVSTFLAELEAGGIDASTIAAIRAQLQQVDANRRPQKQEEALNFLREE